jgi:hypothetical protein
MESEIWPKWLQRGVNRRTIDQTVISPDITTLLKQKNDWLPVTNSYSGILEPRTN